jgi:hypothetical protein
MSSHGEGRFQVTAWDEKAYDDMDGRKLTKAHVEQTFEGDIQGESSVEYLMVYPDESSASVVGVERVEGSLGGKSGSFVLQTVGRFEDGRATSDWTVVPGSGTGELTGLSGEGSFQTEEGGWASYTLDYAFN